MPNRLLPFYVMAHVWNENTGFENASREADFPGAPTGTWCLQRHLQSQPPVLGEMGVAPSIFHARTQGAQPLTQLYPPCRWQGEAQTSGCVCMSTFSPVVRLG